MNAVDAKTLRDLIDRELQSLSDARVLSHIRGLLVEPEIVYRNWDYGKPGEKYPCWAVLNHTTSNTGIAYCEHGFGPRCPWGLVSLQQDEKRGSMGMDSGWFSLFLDAYFDSRAPSDLPIWRVFKLGPSWPGEAMTKEDTWDASWARVQEFKKADPVSKYSAGHGIWYARTQEYSQS